MPKLTLRSNELIADKSTFSENNLDQGPRLVSDEGGRSEAPRLTENRLSLRGPLPYNPIVTWLSDIDVLGTAQLDLSLSRSFLRQKE